MQSKTVGALILAAGQSHRFGSDKRYARLATGQSLLQETTARYLSVLTDVCVVLRTNDDPATLLGEFHTQVGQVCVPSGGGMGDSLAAGMTACEDWTGVFVALGDMPWLALTTLRQLLKIAQTTRHEEAIQPVYDQQPGHPVYFPRSYFPELRQCRGNAGARAWLKGRQRYVEVTDIGVRQDIDCPADLMIPESDQHEDN